MVKKRDQSDQEPPVSTLSGPPKNTTFESKLDELVTTARKGHQPQSPFFNPSEAWLLKHMRVFQDLPPHEQQQILRKWEEIIKEGEVANAEGKAAKRAGPDIAYRLDTGGHAFFSQLGVARRPDLTQYYIDGFLRNRNALAFGEENQTLFAEVLPYITAYMNEHFDSGDEIVQTDRRITDVAGRSFHARQLLFGTHYLQLPYMWRALTFELPVAERSQQPDILEVTLPDWLERLALPEALKERVVEAGLTQLIFKAPTKGLSLHLGFDYVGEHKMGPLSIAMFQLKQRGGLALQSALSAARIRAAAGDMQNTGLVTVGPSLHGKSTMTIMLELEGSELSRRLGLPADTGEGIYPMNDDIVLLQPLSQPVLNRRVDDGVTVPCGIDGTENGFYAVPSGLTREDDPITYDVLRGTEKSPNPRETLENVPVDPETGKPDFLKNPVRNMRMVLSRQRLIERKGAEHLIRSITGGRTGETVHLPMEDLDRIFWQAVMRVNTVIPPLRRLSLEQYIRVLMYGEAVQMGAASGAIGRPYVEYFSDPFIIGLEDENANILYDILTKMAESGLPQHYYAFNTGGVGADSNQEASGAKYKKIPRELTLMLQEALLRDTVKFEYNPLLRSDVAVAILDAAGREAVDLRSEWLPENIYGEKEYAERIVDLRRTRYYGADATGRAGILRYTRVIDELINLNDIPAPVEERELARLLSFFWHVDQSYTSLAELADHLGEGQRPSVTRLHQLRARYEDGVAQGLDLSGDSRSSLGLVGLG